eukprot:13440045-Alexandrium_andersonii.AAC.1
MCIRDSRPPRPPRKAPPARAPARALALDGVTHGRARCLALAQRRATSARDMSALTHAPPACFERTLA